MSAPGRPAVAAPNASDPHRGPHRGRHRRRAVWRTRLLHLLRRTS